MSRYDEFEMDIDDTNNSFDMSIEHVVKEVIKEEKDPTVPQHVKNITQEDIDKWNKEESDPTVPQHVKNITQEDIEKWNKEEKDPTVPEHVKMITQNDIDKWNKEESDPTVPQHVKNITEEDIDKWNKEESDPTVPQHVKNITETDIERWNQKFSGDYSDLTTKPRINNVELGGNRTSADLGIYSKEEVDEKIGNIDSILDILTTGSGV